MRRSKKIILKKVQRGQVISHPLSEEGQWVVSHIDYSPLSGAIVDLLLERVDDARKKRSWNYRLTTTTESRNMASKVVSLYGVMEEVKTWVWKEKY